MRSCRNRRHRERGSLLKSAHRLRRIAKTGAALAGTGLLALGLIAANASGRADCAAPPEPGVNWKRCSFTDRDLAGIDITGADIEDARFHRANLSGAVLDGVRGHRAKFNSTDLSGASLRQAGFQDTDFTRADLSGSALIGADLSRAFFFRADLSGADLTGADVSGTDFQKANLSGATWTDGRICAEGSTSVCRAAREQGAKTQ